MPDFYVDPNEPDPRFPDRPTHPDFALLSNVLQGMDMRAGGGATWAEITGVDIDSLVYAINNRLGTMGIPRDPNVVALYIDAFTAGKLYTEAKQREET